MTRPRWDDPDLKAGTMVRTALWLLSDVGVGNTFTKEQHRRAFAGVAQADRRLRDLRDYGWVIHTNLEDASLKSNEQRLVAVGLPVWQPGVRKQRERENLTAKERMAIFAASNYQCAVCGIAGGEPYPDAPDVRAVLSLGRQDLVTSTEAAGGTFLPYCKRCRSGDPRHVDKQQLLADIRALEPGDRRIFLRWIEQGRRGQLERLWADFRLLSPIAREELRKSLQ